MSTYNGSTYSETSIVSTIYGPEADAAYDDLRRQRHEVDAFLRAFKSDYQNLASQEPSIENLVARGENDEKRKRCLDLIKTITSKTRTITELFDTEEAREIRKKMNKYSKTWKTIIAKLPELDHAGEEETDDEQDSWSQVDQTEIKVKPPGKSGGILQSVGNLASSAAKKLAAAASSSKTPNPSVKMGVGRGTSTRRSLGFPLEATVGKSTTSGLPQLQSTPMATGTTRSKQPNVGEIAIYQNANDKTGVWIDSNAHNMEKRGACGGDLSDDIVQSAQHEIEQHPRVIELKNIIAIAEAKVLVAQEKMDELEEASRSKKEQEEEQKDKNQQEDETTKVKTTAEKEEEKRAEIEKRAKKAAEQTRKQALAKRQKELEKKAKEANKKADETHEDLDKMIAEFKEFDAKRDNTKYTAVTNKKKSLNKAPIPTANPVSQKDAGTNQNNEPASTRTTVDNTASHVRINDDLIFLQAQNIAINIAREARPTTKFSDGGTVNYTTHMQNFDRISSSTGMTPSLILNEMRYWFEGSSNTIIESYCHKKDCDTALKDVRRELDELFGEKIDSAMNRLEHILHLAKIEKDDYKGHLKLYSDLLNVYNQAMITNSHSELDARHNIQKIVHSRFHNIILDKFFEDDQKSLDENGNHLDMDGLLEFLKRRTKIIDNKKGGVITAPIKIAATETTKRQPQQQQHQQRSYAASARAPPAANPPRRTEPARQQQQQQQQCTICTQQHAATECSVLTALTKPDERVEILKQKHLCFHCFKADHGARDCPEGIICTTCNRYHNTLLHGRTYPPRQDGQPQLSTNDRPNTRSNLASTNASIRTASTTTSNAAPSAQPIVPSLPVAINNNGTGNPII